MDSTSSDALIGKQLGDYTLLRVLAHGGMARIYEAEDRRLGRAAAVKVLSQDNLEADSALPQRFEREAKAVAALEHENIIPLYQFGEQDGVYFLAMKLIRGKDFSQELSKLRREGKRMDVNRVLNIVGQVANALDYAHSNGVVHRDVKPSNILVDANDRAVLTDFGLVLRQSIDMTLGTAFGTPRYIAPEQAMLSSRAVPQSDVYALGVILYEALTGEPPFSGEMPIEIAMAHINELPRLPRSINPNIPADAESELLRALEKTPDKRQATAGELVAGIRRAYGFSTHPTTPIMQTVQNTPTEPIDIDPLAVSWDTPTTDIDPSHPVFQPSPELTASQPPKAANKTPLFIGLGVLALVIVGIALFAVLGGQSDDAPATTDQSDTLANTALDDAENAVIRLVYDENNLTMINTGGYTLNVGQLAFERQNSGKVEGKSITRSILPEGACVRWQLQNRQAHTVENCNANLHSNILIGDAAALFWRKEPVSAETFTVHYGDQVVATCPTITRGTQNQCAFEWSINEADAAQGN